MSNEISVTGNKKLKTLYKEFNKNFPYIKFVRFSSQRKMKKQSISS